MVIDQEDIVEEVVCVDDRVTGWPPSRMFYIAKLKQVPFHPEVFVSVIFVT